MQQRQLEVQFLHVLYEMPKQFSFPPQTGISKGAVKSLHKWGRLDQLFYAFPGGDIHINHGSTTA